MSDTQITVTGADIAAGEYQITYYAAGRTVATAGDHYAAYLSVALTMERIMAAHWLRKQPPGAPVLKLEDWVPGSVNTQTGLDYCREQMSDVGPAPALLYLATRNMVRQLVNASWLVEPQYPPQPTPSMGQLPSLPDFDPLQTIVITAAGGAGIAAVTFWQLDRNEKEYQLELAQVHANAEIAKYAKNMEAHLAAGKPIPAPPVAVMTAASAEESYHYWMLGAGLAIGGATVFGLFKAMKRKPARRANPKPPPPVRRRVRTRKARRLRPAAPPGKPPPARQSRKNPLASGHSQATVAKNVAKLRREGYGEAQAVGIALRAARASWRSKNARKAFPAHLQPARPARKKKTAKKKTTASKNRAPARKKKAAKKKQPTKQSFLAAQKRKGRSDKQAAADWKAKQRLRKNPAKRKKTRTPAVAKRANPAGDDIELHPAFVSGQRRREALDKLKAKQPHPLTAPLLGGRYTVLVHRSTKRPDTWQATFFDADGQPYGDSESESWPKLLEHIHMDSVDWEKAKRPNPRSRLSVTKADTARMRWQDHKQRMRSSKKREHAAKLKRAAELKRTSDKCNKRKRKRITMCKVERDSIRQIARDAVQREKAYRKDAAKVYSEDAAGRRRLRRGQRRYSRAESDSLAIHNVPAHLVPLWQQMARNFPLSLQPDHRAELFMEWVEEHPEALGELQHARQEATSDEDYAAAYAEYMEAG